MSREAHSSRFISDQVKNSSLCGQSLCLMTIERWPHSFPFRTGQWNTLSPMIVGCISSESRTSSGSQLKPPVSKRYRRFFIFSRRWNSNVDQRYSADCWRLFPWLLDRFYRDANEYTHPLQGGVTFVPSILALKTRLRYNLTDCGNGSSCHGLSMLSWCAVKRSRLSSSFSCVAYLARQFIAGNGRVVVYLKA